MNLSIFWADRVLIVQLARGAGGCRALKVMSLRGNYGGDEGATCLAESLRKGGLRRLDYSENGVGGEGAAEFGAWLPEVRNCFGLGFRV